MRIIKCADCKAGKIQMNIKIYNVAKVLEADISINGISVIAGLNNTGKSTILKSIYMGLNVFRNSNVKIMNEQKRSIKSLIRKSESYFDEMGYEMLPTALLNDFSLLVCKDIDIFMDDPDNYAYFKKLFSICIDSYKDMIKMTRNEKIYSDVFLMPIFNKVKAVFLRSKEDYMKYIGDMHIRDTFSNQLNNALNMKYADIGIESENGENFLHIINNKIESMSNGMINKPDAIYLPAYNILDYINKSRNNEGIYSPEKEVREYLSATSIIEQSYEDYSEIEYNINSIKEIFEEVIHGKLVKLQSGIFQFKEDDIDSLISTENIASGLKNFLIIQSLVERGKLKRNSVLLIDEPETNLHPEWHMKFAEILVLMYKNMGVFSVVNSHSPYFIRALEVMMANYGIKEKASYYLMRESETNGFLAENVTDKTNRIYEMLYRPLEYL